MVGEVKLSITRSWVQNLSLPDERSNRETSRRIGFYSVYLVSLQSLSFILVYFICIDLHRHLFIHYLSYIIYRKFPICFALHFLANLSNNLSDIICRKFPICFALHFLANLSNNRSYVIYRKFPIYFASVFSAVLNHFFLLYI